MGEEETVNGDSIYVGAEKREDAIIETRVERRSVTRLTAVRVRSRI